MAALDLVFVILAEDRRRSAAGDVMANCVAVCAACRIEAQTGERAPIGAHLFRAPTPEEMPAIREWLRRRRPELFYDDV